jgi:hypothetical protein
MTRPHDQVRPADGRSINHAAQSITQLHHSRSSSIILVRFSRNIGGGDLIAGDLVRERARHRRQPPALAGTASRFPMFVSLAAASNELPLFSS